MRIRHTNQTDLAAVCDVHREAFGRAEGPEIAELVRDGLKQLAGAEVELVFVLGHPDYYPKFGFRPARAFGLEAAHPIRAGHDDAWMVQELTPGVLGRVRGTIQCAEALDEPRHWA